MILGTYAHSGSLALPTVKGSDSSGSVSSSLVISTQSLSARWRWRIEDEGEKKGWLIEIIMWHAFVTVVS